MHQKIGFREKLAYSMGDVSANLLATFIASYAFWFYTEVDGINALAVGTMTLVANIWDAINDPIMGFIVDKGKPTKHGTYRPWIRRAAIPIAVFFILQFTVPDMGMTGKLIWMYVTYIGTDMLFTVINVPYGVLNNVMTADMDERTVLSTFRNIGSNIGSLLVTYATIPLVAFFGNGNDAAGYQRTAILFAIISTAALFWLFYGVKERLEPAKPDLKVREVYKTIFNNKPALCLVISMFLFNTTVNFKFAYNIYYCSIYMERSDLTGIIGSLVFFVAMISLVIVPKMTEILGKRGMLLLGGGVYALTGVVFLVGQKNVLMLYVTAVMFGLCLTLSFPILWGTIPDAVEYGEWKTGIRAPGVVYSACTCANKLAQGVSGWLVGVTLTIAGYSAGAAVQTSGAATGIYWSNALVLIIGGLSGAAAVIPYKLNKKTYDRILVELEERKAGREKNEV
ncbi:MAG TPA: MFS transporter [Candidatus Mediterraneibacter merdipullorum]|nr:MFS transporter [Candidatus Mediterraneibacter merdipullorum]